MKDFRIGLIALKGRILVNDRLIYVTTCYRLVERNAKPASHQLIRRERPSSMLGDERA